MNRAHLSSLDLMYALCYFLLDLQQGDNEIDKTKITLLRKDYSSVHGKWF